MRHNIFKTIQNKTFLKSYVTLSEMGDSKIQILIRNKKVFYRRLSKGIETKRYVGLWNHHDLTYINFKCTSYCSDCGCNRW